MSNGSFTFRGVDISSFGLNYAPDLSNVFVYAPAVAQSHIETFEAHDGGYFYGSWKEPKEFILRCYFEETNIDKGIMGEVYSLFKVGSSGKLIFDRRPWCYYYATVTEPVQTDFTNYLNGLVTINLKAMYPFARSDILLNRRTDRDHDTLMKNSAVFDRDGMELPIEYDLNKTSTIILSNPGSERAALGIAISGDVGDGVIISNNTTGQKCKIVALTKEETTNKNKYVLIDPINGKTTLVGNGKTDLAFKYHEFGFLELEPSFPAVRDLYISYAYGQTITVSNILHDNLIGKYIFIKNDWYKITDQTDKHTLIVDRPPQIYGLERTMVIPMNEITITPETTMDIHIKFIFKPTYA